MLLLSRRGARAALALTLAALIGCGGSSPSSAARSASTGAPVTSGASGSPGAPGSLGANGAPSSLTPARLEDVVTTRLVIQGSGFTSPAHVELASGLVVIGLEAHDVTPTELAVYVPPLFAGTFQVRVGRGGIADYVPGALELAGAPTLDFEVRQVAPANPGLNHQLLYPRAEHQAVALPGGSVLIVGGCDPQGRALAPVERYEPATGVTTVLRPLWEPRVEHQALLLDSGEVLVAGGRYAPANASARPNIPLYCEVIDVATGAARSIFPRIGYAGFAIAPLAGDQALVVGGSFLRPEEAAFVIDASAGTVTPVPPPATERIDAAAVRLASGEVLLIGGADRATGQPLDTVERFDPISRTWSTLPARLTTPRVGAQALAATGLVTEAVVVGGQAAGAPIEAFGAGAFQPIAATAPATADFAAAAIDVGIAVLEPALGTAQLLLRDGLGQEVLLTPDRPRDPQSGTALVDLGQGRLALIGGRASGQPVSEIEVIDASTALPTSPAPPVTWPSTPSATPTATPPHAVVHGVSVPIDDTVAFVLDISGSMAWGTRSFVDATTGQTRTGDWLEAAVHELIRAIDGLDPSVRFNVHLFDCAVRSWQVDAAYADAAAKQSAAAFLLAAQPVGATGTGVAVAEALADPRVGSVVLITDGAPNCGAPDMAGHLSLIHQANAQGAAVFPFGIQSTGAFEQFLVDLAAQTGGRYTFVP